MCSDLMEIVRKIKKIKPFHHILTIANMLFSRTQIIAQPQICIQHTRTQTIANAWSEVLEERGENVATIGVIQLLLDRLRLSMVNNTVNDENNFLLSENIDLRTFDMDSFVSRLTAPQVRCVWMNQKFDKTFCKLFQSAAKSI